MCVFDFSSEPSVAVAVVPNLLEPVVLVVKLALAVVAPIVWERTLEIVVVDLVVVVMVTPVVQVRMLEVVVVALVVVVVVTPVVQVRMLEVMVVDLVVVVVAAVVFTLIGGTVLAVVDVKPVFSEPIVAPVLVTVETVVVVAAVVLFCSQHFSADAPSTQRHRAM